MRNTPRILWLACLLAAGVLTACGGGKPSPQAEVDNAPWEVRLESPLDTVVVAGDDPRVTNNTPPPPPANPPSAGGTSAETTGVNSGSARPVPPDPRNFTPGWRVQVFASSNLQLADDKAAEFRVNSPHPVYVEYEPPYYKVRVGDFLTRQDAERFKEETGRMGWEGAWVTETLVLRPGAGQ